MVPGRVLRLPGWGLALVVAAILTGFQVRPLPGAPSPGKYFLVEEISPLYFRIQPLVSGPISTSLRGHGGPQQLLTRQEGGRTVIYARVPATGATLIIRVGEHRLRLWTTGPGTTAPPHFDFQEE